MEWLKNRKTIETIMMFLPVILLIGLFLGLYLLKDTPPQPTLSPEEEARQKRAIIRCAELADAAQNWVEESLRCLETIAKPQTSN